MAEITYSAYLENAHKQLLDHDGTDVPTYSVMEVLNSAFSASPYGDYAGVDVNSLFLGGSPLSAFPSLFDMFGKFMAGLDIEILWDQVLQGTVYGPVVDNLVKAHSVYLQDEIDTRSMPNLSAGLRDCNSVMSSVFLNAKAVLQDTKVKAVSKFSAELQYKLVDIAKQRWSDHLTWNKQVLAMYGEYAKLYLSAKMDVDTQKYDFLVKDRLWNIKLFEYARAMLGAIQGSPTTPGLNEPSQFMRSISGAMSGAALGASIGGGTGAAVGGVLGLAASFIK